jgi:hypothetical protein
VAKTAGRYGEAASRVPVQDRRAVLGPKLGEERVPVLKARLVNNQMPPPYD